MGKQTALATWLDQAIDTPRAWGVHDCTLWPADWVRRCGHADPASPWRGRYRTALGAARLARANGGLEALWAAGAERAGLVRTRRPLAGDVGLVAMATREVGPALAGHVGAICIGGGDWAVITTGGVWMGRAPVLDAWGVTWRTR